MLVSLVVAALSLLSSSARAAEPAIWYRAGEGCPDGASFLERLDRRSVRARLAAVGDPIDFVVTLGTSGDRSSGRLERQTKSGTIAIREVTDPSCEAVADALALSLALSLDPAAQQPSAGVSAAENSAETVAPRDEQPPPPAQSQPPAVLPASSPLPPKSALPASSFVPPTEQRGPAAEERAALRLGAVAAAADLFEGPWLLGAGAFAESEAPASFVLPRATLRLALQGGFRADADAAARVWLAAARIEACPLAVGGSKASLRPCAALDAGAIGASAAGMNDTAAWSAVAAHVRFRFDLGRLGLEFQAGGIAPITRYEVAAANSGAILEETRTIGFAGAMGVSFRLE